jgi:hypothetical protein
MSPAISSPSGGFSFFRRKPLTAARGADYYNSYQEIVKVFPRDAEKTAFYRLFSTKLVTCAAPRHAATCSPPEASQVEDVVVSPKLHTPPAPKTRCLFFLFCRIQSTRICLKSTRIP